MHVVYTLMGDAGESVRRRWESRHKKTEGAVLGRLVLNFMDLNI